MPNLFRCPRCGDGAVFAGLMTPATACAVCGVSFEGDFSGARWLSYYVVLLAALPVFLGLLWRGASLILVLGATVAVAVAVTPLAVRLTVWAALRAQLRD